MCTTISVRRRGDRLKQGIKIAPTEVNNRRTDICDYSHRAVPPRGHGGSGATGGGGAMIMLRSSSTRRHTYSPPP